MEIETKVTLDDDIGAACIGPLIPIDSDDSDAGSSGSNAGADKSINESNSGSGSDAEADKSDVSNSGSGSDAEGDKSDATNSGSGSDAEGEVDKSDATNSGSGSDAEDDQSKNDTKTTTSSGAGSSGIARPVKQRAVNPFYTQLKTDKKEVNEAVNQDSVKRLDFLVQQAELFSHFMRPAISKAIGQSVGGEPQPGTSKARGRKPKEAVGGGGMKNFYGSSGAAAKSKSKKPNMDFTQFDSTPSYMVNGTLRDYQVHGLNFLISLYENGINGILADEMGLGKTIQAIALLGYLKNYHGTSSLKGIRHLVVIPKSTMSNWMKEFEKWCPSLNVICLLAAKDDRKHFIKKVVLNPRNQWNVCVTTYEMVLAEIGVLAKFGWGYIVVDEGHRLKNENAKLSGCLRRLSSRNRLLLTGTPIQNNIHELWALLNFILPDVFKSSQDFDSWFDTTTCMGDQTVVQRLQSVLRPFWLRRIKSDVEKSIPAKKEYKVFVQLTPMQLEWYRKSLLKQLPDLMGFHNTQATHLLSLLTNLRKITNHPYLFPGAEPGPPYENGPHIVENSAKMIVLDKLLIKLIGQGSKILLFSQYTAMLDLIEDYLWLKDWKFFRLDGNTSHEDRAASIEKFNSDTTNEFPLFLISTRAGGLGINLTAADSVIIYESDWNPQMDIQAIDRCHRIGQTKQVNVYRLILQDTVDERIVQRAEAKKHLDHVIIQQGRFVNAEEKMNKKTMYELIQADAANIDTLTSTSTGSGGSAGVNIDDVLLKSKEREAQLEAAAEKDSLEQLQELGLLDSKLKIRLAKVSQELMESQNAMEVAKGFDSVQLTDFEGKDYRALRETMERTTNENLRSSIASKKRKGGSLDFGSSPSTPVRSVAKKSKLAEKFDLSTPPGSDAEDEKENDDDITDKDVIEVE